MALGYLAVHLQTQYGKETGGIRHWVTKSPNGEPRTYNMAFPTARALRNCPIEGRWGRATTWTVIRVHFFHWHVRDTMIIL